MPVHFESQELQVRRVVASPYGNNAYVVVCPSTGEGVVIDAPQDTAKVLDEARGARVKALLITHNHFDHLEGFARIKAALGVPAASHRADAAKLPEPPEFFLEDGDILPVGSLSIRVLHTPGHTPGSTCLLVSGHLFSGDTLFPGGPGRTASPEALREEIASITGKLLTLPPETAVHPGHGEDTTIGRAREEYAVFASRPHAEDLHGDVLWQEG